MGIPVLSSKEGPVLSFWREGLAKLFVQSQSNCFNRGAAEGLFGSKLDQPSNPGPGVWREIVFVGVGGKAGMGTYGCCLFLERKPDTLKGERGAHVEKGMHFITRENCMMYSCTCGFWSCVRSWRALAG
jgi:hypothetical protein